MTGRISIIGGDWMQIDKLARRVQDAIGRKHEYTRLWDTPNMRGRYFDVKLDDGRIARVTVELERVET